MVQTFLLLLPLVFLAATAPTLGGGAPNRPYLSPEIAPDRTVIFRIRAPDAAVVELGGDWAPDRVSMRKDDGGVWSATVGPLEPGLYSYEFFVNGIATPDPVNPAMKPGRYHQSLLDCTGPDSFYGMRDVPHGVLHHHLYESKAIGETRRVIVYTPPGYDSSRRSRYPTLYLFHGSGDDETAWPVIGRANLILDNLIAEKRAAPMVVVMPYGHVPPGQGYDFNRFEKDLFDGILPFVEKNYRVRSGAGARAIAGLSMGGGQSLGVGLRNLDRFAWVAGFSASARDPLQRLEKINADPNGANRSLRLLWIGCGRADFLHAGNLSFHQTLVEKGIRHVWHETAGGHEWPEWRDYLHRLLPLLFQPKAKVDAAMGEMSSRPDDSRSAGISIEARAVPMRVLFVGNSYTFFHHLPAMITRIAAIDPPGRRIETAHVTTGGWTLEQHIESGEALRRIREKGWDYVVLQEQSLRPIHDTAAFHISARRLAAEIRKVGAVPVFYLTWARKNLPEDQARLNAAYETIAREVGARVAPVGKIWAEMGRQDPEIALHEEDLSHPTPTGSYLAALAFVRLFAGRMPSELPATLRGLPATEPDATGTGDITIDPRALPILAASVRRVME